MSSSTRTAALALLLGAAAAVAIPGGPAAAQPEPRPECAGTADFDGDGCTDMVAGDPTAAVNGQANAGRINILYGKGKGSLLVQGASGVPDTAEAGDQFGSVLQTINLDSDRYSDLVVGVPGEGVGAADDAGSIQVIWGSPDGLGAGRAAVTLQQGVFGIAGGPEAGDRFGAAMRINRTGGEDGPHPVIAFGAPGEDIGTVADAGLAGVVTFDPQTAAVTATKSIDQTSPGISGDVEAGDRFGQSVEVFQGPGGLDCPVTGTNGLTLVVGVPGEDFAGLADAGMAHVAVNLTGDTLLSQNEPGVEGTAEAGDQFSASLALDAFCETGPATHVRLAVGTPGEDIGTIANAGMIHSFLTEDDQIPLPPRWSAHQDSANVEDVAEAGDRFGSVLTVSDTSRAGGGGSVLVGIPGEDVGGAAGARAVHAPFLDQFTPAPGSDDVFVTAASAGWSVKNGAHLGASIFGRAGIVVAGAPDDAGTGGVLLGLPVASTTVFAVVPGQDGVPDGAARFGVAVD